MQPLPTNDPRLAPNDLSSYNPQPYFDSLCPLLNIV